GGDDGSGWNRLHGCVCGLGLAASGEHGDGAEQKEQTDCDTVEYKARLMVELHSSFPPRKNENGLAGGRCRREYRYGLGLGCAWIFFKTVTALRKSFNIC